METAPNKSELINDYRTHDGDTGSPEVQIALLTARIKHLTEHLWATVDQPHATEVLDSLFLSEGVPRPRPAVQANSLTLIKSLVVSGGFACLLPDHLFAREIRDGKVCRLDLAGTPLVRSAGLIRRQEAFRRPVADALSDEFRETTTNYNDAQA